MTKLNELDEKTLRSCTTYVDDLWESYGTVRQQALGRINNYLFVLNTGSLVAMATYLATRDPTFWIITAVVLFGLGTICCLIHATIDYYAVENLYSNYKSNVRDLYKYELDWEVFLDRINHTGADWYMHVIGWMSGACFLAGLITSIVQMQ